MQVYIVDDDSQVLAANQFLLQALGYSSLGWQDPEQFLAEVDTQVPAILLLDLAMPKLDGLQVQAELMARNSLVSVILLTGHGDVPQAVAAMKQGAVDFLEKPVDVKRLSAAFAQAKTRVEQLRRHEDIRQLFARLSAREREVVSLVAEGLTNKAIAEQLCVAVRTIEVHRAAAMGKLKVANIAELLNHWQLLNSTY
ncbi:DNA-binding response regulator [Oceanisphaera profunda]|uniref:DNA-binding response regulator n=1 Tax=Oceanisphaera profunda TaxID=1416627 RepID=A0A1Y0D9A2_9GAMM|nr:response regulator [Oceanisphaera profunda]ART83696.1 DNA-binding response regulator [Oceanisphaera profunda]